MKKKKQMKSKGLHLFLSFGLCLSLSSCSFSLEEVEWDAIVDDVLEVAVAWLLEDDGNSAGASGTAGNLPPLAPSTPAQEAVPYYYNEANPHSSFLFQGMTVEALETGYEISGTVLGEKIMDENSYALATEGEGTFPLTFHKYLDNGTLREETVTCTIESKKETTFTFSCSISDGESYVINVDDWGIMTYEDGSIFYEPLSFIHLYVENSSTRLEGAVDFSLIQEIPEGYFTVEAVVINGIVTSLTW
ncbi:MAG: hypothetical protein R3Y63_12705 [Eubacteriales bacterium]